MKSLHQSFPTVAEVQREIMTWADLPLSRRRTLVSSLNLLCRTGGKRSPATVLLDPAVCLPAIDTASAVALGIASKTLQNHRANLRYAMRRRGLLAPVRRYGPTGDPAWAVLEKALPRRFHPHRLRAFMRDCDEEGLPPGEVTSAHLEDYARRLTASQGSKNVRANVSEAARQWNKMRGLIPGWPDTELALGPPEGRIQTLPLSAYPLHREAEDYLAWLVRSPEDAEEDDEEARDPASPETVATRRKGLRLLCWAMLQTGSTPDELTDLGDLVRFDNARRCLRLHRDRLGKPRPDKPNERLPTHGTGMLAATLQSLAIFRKLPGEADARLRRMLKVYRPKRQCEIGDELSALLDRLEDPETEARLLHLPALLLHKARHLRDGWTSKGGVNRPPKPHEACWMAALAAAIEILLHLPLRVHDLTRLRLDQELAMRQAGERGPVEAHLRVTANKNGRLVETWMRGEPAAVLVEYLRDFRPLGPHPTTTWVFPNRDGAARPRGKGGFSERIARAIHAHTGVRMTVHDFRAFAAARILADHPHAIEDIRALLGHNGFEIALRHYRRTNRQGAAQRVSEGIGTRRRRSAATVILPGLPLDLARWRRRQA